MPNAPKTPTRSFRVGDELWQRAQETAHRRGETVSGVLVDALELYVRHYGDTTDPAEEVASDGA